MGSFGSNKSSDRLRNPPAIFKCVIFLQLAPVSIIEKVNKNNCINKTKHKKYVCMVTSHETPTYNFCVYCNRFDKSFRGSNVAYNLNIIEIIAK